MPLSTKPTEGLTSPRTHAPGTAPIFAACKISAYERAETARKRPLALRARCRQWRTSKDWH
jgi:hypothetical protein